MLHTIATNTGRVIVRPAADLGSVVLGINAAPGAASVRLDASTLRALLFALENAAEDCGMTTEAAHQCPPCNHDCSQGRTCPAVVRQQSTEALPA